MLVLVLEGIGSGVTVAVFFVLCKKEKSSEFRWLGFKPSLDEVGRFLLYVIVLCVQCCFSTVELIPFVSCSIMLQDFAIRILES